MIWQKRITLVRKSWINKLIMDVLTTKREKYENLSKVLQNLVELSKSINSDMKTLHEDLSEIPWVRSFH